MSSADILRSRLDRAKQRVEYCRKERNRFESTMDVDDYHAQRTWRKLDEDLKQAERDAGHAAHALTAALAEQHSFWKAS